MCFHRILRLAILTAIATLTELVLTNDIQSLGRHYMAVDIPHRMVEALLLAADNLVQLSYSKELKANVLVAVYIHPSARFGVVR